jgi:hypothetical protein
VAALEERYWHAFNDLSLQLGTHLQERDATLAKVHCACRSLVEPYFDMTVYSPPASLLWQTCQHLSDLLSALCAPLLLWPVCNQLQMHISASFVVHHAEAVQPEVTRMRAP